MNALAPRLTSASLAQLALLSLTLAGCKNQAPAPQARAHEPVQAAPTPKAPPSSRPKQGSPSLAQPAPPPPAGPAREARPTAKLAPGEIAGLQYIERSWSPSHAPKDIAELPVLVMIHGLGDNPRDFLTLGKVLRTPHRALSLQGLSPYSGSFGEGFAWFKTRVKDRDRKKLASEVDHAAREVARALRALNKQEKRQGRRFFVTGFSQGGILSYALAVQYPELVKAAFPVAGLLPPESRNPGKSPSKTSITAFHGQSDQIVPLPRAQELGTWLEKTGFDYQIKSYPDVGHRIPPVMHRPLIEAIERSLATSRTQ